jgi:hypothetical protein
MATKKTKAAEAVESVLIPHDFASDKDAAYSQANADEKNKITLTSVAQYIMMKYPKYPTEKDEALEERLAEGYLLNLAEQKRGMPRQYGYVDGNYINVTELAEKPKIIDVISVAYARGLSNYEYRVLDNPDKKKVVQDYREMASTHISQQLARLRGKIAELNDPEKKKKRGDNKTVEQHCIAWFDSTEKKVKLGQKQGDPHGDPLKYLKAKDAFWMEMFGKPAPVSKK